MNPVLLKPESDVGAQVIVQGKRVATLRARDYAALKPSLMPAVLESFERLKAKTDLVLEPREKVALFFFTAFAAATHSATMAVLLGLCLAGWIILHFCAGASGPHRSRRER